jgi:hypothetical protein
MFVRSVLPHLLASSVCPENAYVIRGECILRGSAAEASVELASKLSKVLTSQTELRSVDALLGYLGTQDIAIPAEADIEVAINFTKNFVVTDGQGIIEKMSEESERLLIVVGALLSTVVLIAAISRPAIPR